jgi:hypothetical protein
MGNWMWEDDESSWWLNAWLNARRCQEWAWAPVRLGRGRSVTIVFVLNVTAVKVRLGSIVGQAQQGRLSDVVSRRHAHLSWARWTSRPLVCYAMWLHKYGVGSCKAMWEMAMDCNCIKIRVWELSVHFDSMRIKMKTWGKSIRTKCAIWKYQNMRKLQTNLYRAKSAIWKYGEKLEQVWGPLVKILH